MTETPQQRYRRKCRSRAKERQVERLAGTKRCARCHEEKPASEFRLVGNNLIYLRLGARCRACQVLYEAEWRAANRDWLSFADRLRYYGLTLDQYHAKAEAQDFLCAICGEEAMLFIDHDHATESVRGLLCPSCNTGLGAFRDSPESLRAAIEYLRKTGIFGKAA